MKLGIVLNTKDEEKAYNAFRLGAYTLKSGHSVNIFLLGEGVEAYHIEGKSFDVAGQIKAFAEGGGAVLSCKSCLEARKMGEGTSCNVSTMKDLMGLIEGSDKVVSFG